VNVSYRFIYAFSELFKFSFFFVAEINKAFPLLTSSRLPLFKRKVSRFFSVIRSSSSIVKGIGINFIETIITGLSLGLDI
jgi:hypothetical protein